MSEYQPPAYPAIVALLRNRRLVVNSASIATALVFFWFAWQLSRVDLVVLGVVLGAAVHFVVRVAVEVVALVGDTLMPK